MAEWEIIRTDTFLKDLKKLRKNAVLLRELDVKIQRLKEEPIGVGDQLHGELYPSKSTRVYGKYRLIFLVDERNKKVYSETTKLLGM